MTQTDRKNGLIGAVAIKPPCVVATTANITLSGTQTIDDIAIVADDRVLVKDQTTDTENGIYLASSSAWTRATDFDGNLDIVSGTVVLINSGTANTNNWYKVSTADPITIDTSSITFATTAFTGTVADNVDFNSNKITDLANGSARTDSIALGQVQDNTYEYLGENGGSANTYTWTPSPTLPAYAAGQSWIILIGSGDGNTSASTGNISAVGSRAIEKSDGAGSTTALVSGDMVAGSLYKLIDNGTKLVLQNPEKPYLDGVNFTLTVATQSDQETGTETNKPVVPAVQHYHPSAAKFWVNSDGSSTIDASYNVTSITDNGTGDYTINIATDFSSIQWCVVVGVGRGVTNNDITAGVDYSTAPTAAIVRIFTIAISSLAALDANQVNVAGFGDQ